MANEIRPKPDMAAGLEALAKGAPEAPQHPLSPNTGNVIAPCKTESCSSALDFGFTYDTLTWIQEFKPQKLKCPLCKQEYLYSSIDLVAAPSK